MNKSLLIIIIVVLVIAAGIGGYFLFMQKGAPGPNEIVIGYNADMSAGPTATFGVWAKQGFEIAVDEINAQGGILGKKIRTVILDDKADKEVSMKNMEQLIFQEKALAVVGPGNSANALYWLPLAQENETIVISVIASASEITTMFSERPRNYIFGLRVLDKDQVRLFIAWAVRKTNNGKIAVIYDTTSYGLQGLKDVNEVLSRWGKTAVLAKSFDRGASVASLTQLIESAKSAQADAIVFYALADSCADLLKAADKVKNYNPVLIGTAANVAGLWQLAGPLAAKLVFTAPVSADYNENAKALNQKVVAKYGKAPILLSSVASGYDVVYLLKEAIEKAGKIDKVAVRDAMENIDSLSGIMRVFEHPYSKQNHELLGPKDAFLSHWTDGKIVMIDEDVSNLEIR